jgi:hypothetical protein
MGTEPFFFISKSAVGCLIDTGQLSHEYLGAGRV